MGTDNASPTVFPNEFESFLDKLVTLKQFPPGLPNTFKENVKTELRPLLLQQINLSLYEALSAQDKVGFARLIDSNCDNQSLQTFFSEHLDHQEFIISQAMLAFQKTYLGHS